jgi:AcrR family transcriptional regulator
MADEKLTRTVEAAGEVFLRYGYARTTMGDIAKAAGMSRPALYLLFPGKEQVFSAATMHLAHQRLEAFQLVLIKCFSYSTYSFCFYGLISICHIIFLCSFYAS